MYNYFSYVAVVPKCIISYLAVVPKCIMSYVSVVPKCIISYIAVVPKCINSYVAVVPRCIASYVAVAAIIQFQNNRNRFRVSKWLTLNVIVKLSNQDATIADLPGNANKAPTPANDTMHTQGRSSFAKPSSAWLCKALPPLRMLRGACSVWGLICISS